MSVNHKLEKHHPLHKSKDYVTLKIAKFNIGDVEDVDIYFGAVWWSFTQEDKGKWVKEHAQDLVYHTHLDHNSYSHVVTVTGVFKKEDALIFKLKWGIDD
jgi:hypothetical protein